MMHNFKFWLDEGKEQQHEYGMSEEQGETGEIGMSKSKTLKLLKVLVLSFWIGSQLHMLQYGTAKHQEAGAC